MMIPPVLLVAALASAPSVGFVAASTATAPTAAVPTPTVQAQDAKEQDPLEVLQNGYREWVARKGGSDDIVAARRKFAERAEAFMKADPRGSMAVRARVWLVLSNLEPTKNAQLLDELLAKDIASPDLIELTDALRPNSMPQAREVLETLVEKAGDRSVRGRALRTLADHVKAELDGVRAVDAGQIERGALAKSLGNDRAVAALKLGVDGLTAQYADMLGRVAKDYADVKDSRGRAIGPRAEGALFEMQHLQIGMIAPDIEAEDIDGTTFKLSDYRGKVVVVDFWGHW